MAAARPARLLFAWLGSTDLRAAEAEGVAGDAPLALAASTRPVDEVIVLSGHAPARTRAYGAWLHRQTKAAIVLHAVTLQSPTHFGDIHQAAVAAIGDAIARHGARVPPELTFHLSPGTPAMASIFVLLGKTRFPATLIESSREYGVREVEVPFSLSAEFLPDLLRGADLELERLARELPPAAPAFDALVHRSVVMKRLLQRARRVALRSVAVLIEGESGTGKELLARAIHHGSPRAGGPFVAVNCGAIPETLVESELFGHERGAFTGALHARPGHFRAAAGGTLFLDEVHALPKQTQVKLLRALQENEVVPVGASAPVRVDARVIAAANVNLLGEVARGSFRGDLFYRLAVAILLLPPLRERPGDLDLLIDALLARIDAESAADPGYEPRRLEPAARAALHGHGWPGNVRELANTLRRATLWTSGAAITAADMREAILPSTTSADSGVLDRPLTDGFDLQALLGDVARHYLHRALTEAHGNKSQAAKTLGFANPQTFANWLQRHGDTLSLAK